MAKAELAQLVTDVLAGRDDSKLSYLELIESHADMVQLRNILAKHAEPGLIHSVQVEGQPFLFTSAGLRLAETVDGTHRVRPIALTDLSALELNDLQRIIGCATYLAANPDLVAKNAFPQMEYRMPADTTPRGKLALLRQSERELAATGVLAKVAGYDVPSARAFLSMRGWELQGERSRTMCITGRGFRVVDYPDYGEPRLRAITVDDMAHIAHVAVSGLVGVAQRATTFLPTHVEYAKRGTLDRFASVLSFGRLAR